MQLKNGVTTTDPRLGRIPQVDPRSMNFPVRTLLGDAGLDKPLRGYTWPVYTCLDQGQEGSCVGHGFAHELAAKPRVIPNVTHDTALSIYFDAQKNDPWPGGAYPGADPQYEGTSTLAGAQTLTARGYYSSYHWAFSEKEMALAIGYLGPVVIGINWYEGMFTPNSGGFLEVTGQVAGGHCILVNGFSPKGGYYQVWNSWGPGWGQGGAAKIARGDMARLILEGGDVCVPQRTRKKA